MRFVPGQYERMNMLRNFNLYIKMQRSQTIRRREVLHQAHVLVLFLLPSLRLTLKGYWNEILSVKCCLVVHSIGRLMSAFVTNLRNVIIVAGQNFPNESIRFLLVNSICMGRRTQEELTFVQAFDVESESLTFILLIRAWCQSRRNKNTERVTQSKRDQ